MYDSMAITILGATYENYTLIHYFVLIVFYLSLSFIICQLYILLVQLKLDFYIRFYVGSGIIAVEGLNSKKQEFDYLKVVNINTHF